MARSLALLALLLASGAATAQAHRVLAPEAEMPGTRVALVFGNGDYAYTEPLPNPSNDANDLTAALRRVGFTVLAGINLSDEEMHIALSDFIARAAEADVALFFYAGHGVQVGDKNFLLPVDANIQHQVEVPFRSMRLNEVMELLADSGVPLKVIILDACRNNPFRETWRGTGDGGWANTSGPEGSLIAFATAPGALASDNSAGRNGLFTEALLAEVERPGVELRDLLRVVRFRVTQASGGLQQPVFTPIYNGDFYFVPPGMEAPDARPPVTEASPGQRPLALRPDVESINTRAAYAVSLFESGDYTASAEALEAPAEAGHAEALSALGHLYQHGLGVKLNTTRAAELYQRAADLEHPAAQTNLGYLYEHGLGVPLDEAKAARLYTFAADQGRAAAMNNLGAMLMYGRGIEKDVTRAAELFRRAAQQNLPTAEANYAFILEQGIGVEANEFQAALYYLRAARQDHPWALYRLGAMYEKGLGGSPDPAEAAKHYTRAADLGILPARDALNRLRGASGGEDGIDAQ